MDASNRHPQSWMGSVIKSIQNDLRLRRMLMPIRVSQFNSKVKKEDKLGMKPIVFTSMFILFNASLLSLYLTFKGKDKVMRVVKAPLVLACFATLAYKLQVQWISREIIRKCEHNSSQVAYFTRKMLVEECGDSHLVRPRLKILQAKNKQYEKIYTIQ